MYLTGLLCVFVGSDFFKGILMACSADSLSCCKNIFYVAKKIELTARFRRRRLFFCYYIGAWRAKSPFASRRTADALTAVLSATDSQRTPCTAAAEALQYSKAAAVARRLHRRSSP